tara:strand:- start:482 stop:670 length:189 start_codon:yes stop_codon:yes gene_type:complete
MPNNSQQFLAIFLLVIALWIFTDVPLFISGILGVTLSVMFGIVIAASYSFSPNILFIKITVR